ncbi:MAG: hypothetical protein ACR2OU_19185 [Thermomicrobiales bacterium]
MEATTNIELLAEQKVAPMPSAGVPVIRSPEDLWATFTEFTPILREPQRARPKIGSG